MEQEWTDEEETKPSEPLQPTRRSARATTSRTAEIAKAEEAENSDLNIDFELEAEWRPTERRVRRRVSSGRGRRGSRRRGGTRGTTGRPRGRPRRLTERDLPKRPSPTESEFDVYDEDKTPEADHSLRGDFDLESREVAGESVAAFGLEEEEEEESTEGSVQGDVPEFHAFEQLKPPPAMERVPSTSTGRDQVELGDDEDTQFSVEAELAQYARQDAAAAVSAAESHQDFRHLLQVSANRPNNLPKMDESKSSAEHSLLTPEDDITVDRREVEEVPKEVVEVVLFEESESNDALMDAEVAELSSSLEQSHQIASHMEAAGPSTAFAVEEIDDDDSPSSVIELTFSQLSVGGELIDVPDLMLENESVFYQVLTQKAYYMLPEETRAQLNRHLPRSAQSEADVKLAVADALTYNPNFYFGCPLKLTFNRIKNGFYNPERPTDVVQLQENRRVWYDHFIRNHYMKLFKKLLVTRHALLEKTAMAASHEFVDLDLRTFANQKKLRREEEVRARAKKRARMLIDFAAGRAPGDPLSSDESDEDTEDRLDFVVGGESTQFDPDFAGIDLDMYQPAQARSIDEMLRTYKKQRKKNPDCPAMDTTGITLEDVYERAGLSVQSERNFVQMPPAVAMGPPRRRRRRRHQVVDEESEGSPQIMPNEGYHSLDQYLDTFSDAFANPRPSQDGEDDDDTHVGEEEPENDPDYEQAPDSPDDDGTVNGEDFGVDDNDLE